MYVSYVLYSAINVLHNKCKHLVTLNDNNVSSTDFAFISNDQKS